LLCRERNLLLQNIWNYFPFANGTPVKYFSRFHGTSAQTRLREVPWRNFVLKAVRKTDMSKPRTSPDRADVAGIVDTRCDRDVGSLPEFRRRPSPDDALRHPARPPNHRGRERSARH